MTTYLGKSCSFCLPRVPFVNCRQFMYLVISLLVLRAGYGIWLYQFLIIAYRFTVSILSIVSKSLERSIFFQLNELLTKNNLLYEYQSGFRSRYSTDTCLIHLLDDIKGNNDRGLYTGMIMLDLQKAFDTVDHSILCKKLEGMGVISIEWFKSYLSGRQQVVTIDCITSCPGLVTCGVPQGSIPGPLPFLCYVNDMVTSVSAAYKLILYADDSAIMFAHKNFPM